MKELCLRFTNTVDSVVITARDTGVADTATGIKDCVFETHNGGPGGVIDDSEVIGRGTVV